MVEVWTWVPRIPVSTFLSNGRHQVELNGAGDRRALFQVCFFKNLEEHSGTERASEPALLCLENEWAQKLNQDQIDFSEGVYINNTHICCTLLYGENTNSSY